MAVRKRPTATIIKEVMTEIARIEKEAEKAGQIFVGITKEQLEEKLRRKNSPIIGGSTWANVTLGSTMNFTVYFYNPDPFVWQRLFVHAFIGSGTMIPDAGAATASIDRRFPTLTLPRWIGVTLGVGNWWNLTFPIRVPASVDRTNYLGNAFLFRGNILGVDQLLDRASFIFEVS
jgi:hypothetical protein